MPIIFLIFSLLIPSLSLANCQPPQAEPDRLVANYRIHQHNGPKETTSELQFVRLADEVLRIRPAMQTAELWRRGDNERNEFYRYFLDAKRTVYYPAGDLLALNIHRSWQSANSLVDKQVLPLLEAVGEEQVFCQTARHYRGELQGRQLELLWLTSLELPAYLKIRNRDNVYELQLEGFGQPAEIERQLASWRRFDSIDYADVGDSESDPFIAKMIRQGFIEHGASGMYDSNGHPIGGHGH